MNNNQLILNDLKQLLFTKFPNLIDKIILFGSQINQKFTEFSDYDILIILKNDYDWQLESDIIDLCYDIDLKYNIITDIKIISQKELNEPRGKQSYIQDAINTGIYA
jgi:predicted nucleotidyltransferase